MAAALQFPVSGATAMTCQNILETVSNTPVVRLNHLEVHLAAGLWVKVESANPCGSIKDSPALWSQ
jgi:cysteine synthase